MWNAFCIVGTWRRQTGCPTIIVGSTYVTSVFFLKHARTDRDTWSLFLDPDALKFLWLCTVCRRHQLTTLWILSQKLSGQSAMRCGTTEMRKHVCTFQCSTYPAQNFELYHLSGFISMEKFCFPEKVPLDRNFHLTEFHFSGFDCISNSKFAKESQ